MQTMNICKKCNQLVSNQYRGNIGDIMQTKQVCFHCAFWLEKMEPTTTGKRIVIDGSMYFIPNKSIGVKGCSGRKFKIQTETEIIETNDLWVNGEIPEDFKENFPDNAKFIVDEFDNLNDERIKYFDF